ncbi:hypothetical protein [Streptomyces sp. NPDC056987]|uniref:hypothetical protein n=1 Tax=Streptomyces sp. NPDC056987 TaxID=3345988 RepID=UPI00363CBB30
MAAMHTDDDVYQVDNIFLGPRGTSFPWRARYQAYGVASALTVIMLIIENKLGVIGLWGIAYGMLAVIFLTRKIMPHVTHEHSVKALLKTVINEVRAPRSHKSTAVTTEMSVSGIQRRHQL